MGKLIDLDRFRAFLRRLRVKLKGQAAEVRDTANDGIELIDALTPYMLTSRQREKAAKLRSFLMLVANTIDEDLL